MQLRNPRLGFIGNKLLNNPRLGFIGNKLLNNPRLGFKGTVIDFLTIPDKDLKVQ